MNLPRAWEGQAQAWAKWVRAPDGDPWHEYLNWPAFAALIPPHASVTVDFGCGEGRLGRALPGHRLIGIDTSPTLADSARQTGAYEAVYPTLAVIPQSAATLVIAYMSLHDVDDLDGTIREIARVLSPGGALCAAIVHPFASAHAAPYNRETRYADERGGFGFHGMHRPLASYLNTLIEHRLLVELVREPEPSAAAIAQHPPLAKALKRPPFLHLRARPNT